MCMCMCEDQVIAYIHKTELVILIDITPADLHPLCYVPYADSGLQLISSYLNPT